MYANLKPFSVMGLPNKMSSSEKESHATKKGDLCDTKETILHKPEADKSVFSAPLKMRVQCIRGVDEDGDGDGDGDGGCKTPKGEVVLPKCPPPPPRKPKSAPARKRKNEERVLLDLSSEIDSIFPDNILRDFMCGKIKKARTQTHS